MAILNTLKRDNYIMLTPLRYENKGEEWVTCKLDFFKDAKKQLSTVASFIQDYEIEFFINAMRKLVDGRLDSFKSNFLEPYFSFKATKSSGNLQISAVYIEGVYSEENNTGKEIDFLASDKDVSAFLDELQKELESIKK